MPKREHESGGGGQRSELHDHGDGTFHTMTGGQKTEHQHIGAAMVHMAHHHAPEGGHSHVMHHMEGHTMHHMSESGQASGPHEAANMDELKGHMENATGEGGGEEYGGESQHESMFG